MFPSDPRVVRLAERRKPRSVAPIAPATLHSLRNGGSTIGYWKSVREQIEKRRARRQRATAILGSCAIAFTTAYFIGEFVRAAIVAWH